MSNSFDTIVLGLGAMGSAALYQLAKRKVKVLGVDQFSPPHTLGSTHGDTRITRQAIGEGEFYVPIVLRSYEIWDELEKASGEKLLTKCGGLILSDQQNDSNTLTSNFFKTTISAAEKYDIEHELLDQAEVRKRFPQFKVNEKTAAYYEKNAGYLCPEKCVETQIKLAEKLGAEVRTNEKVLEYSVDEVTGKVKVKTDKGEYEAEKVIVSVGPWIKNFLVGAGEEYQHIFKILRQVLYWFDVEKGSPLLSDQCPIYIWEYGQDFTDDIYGFPGIDGERGGVKIACEKENEVENPDAVNREVSTSEVQSMYNRSIKDRIIGMKDRLIRSATCLYTSTPDHNFVIDFHPQYPNVIIASPCSGHGFKHSATIGEILAQMVVEGEARLDIFQFSLKRFSLLS